MEYIYIGEIVNTHGIKGEVRMCSDFKYKDKVFIKDFKFYLGNRKEELTVNTYRHHKHFDMVTFQGIDDINEAIAYKGDLVYVNREDVKIDGYFNEDLVGLTVINKNDNKVVGIVNDVVNNSMYDLLMITGNTKNHLIPLLDEFIVDVSLKEKTIVVNVIEGLINEN